MSISKRTLFLRHVGQTSSLPLSLEISRAGGINIFDTAGKMYYDFNSGISVSALGHQHPKVIKAIKNQVDSYMHTMVYGEHIQSPQVNFAKLLCEQLDNKLNSIYFLNSGSEAIELAMKIAKRHTGRYEIISCKQAYHGSTQGSEALRSDKNHGRAYMPGIPGIRHLNFNLIDDLQKISTHTAAVILEPVQGEAGVKLPNDAYLRAVSNKCKEVGALFILDEIQTGFGRTGHLFAHQKYKVVPDVMCIGKAMGGGLPLSGVVADQSLLQSLTNNPDLGHITTFGGHPGFMRCGISKSEGSS